MTFPIPDLFGSSASPGVRRPTFEIAFGAGGGSGPTDLLSSAAAAIGFGGAGGEDPWQRSLARLTIDLALAPDADGAELELAADAQAPTVEFADEGTIGLGYQDEGNTNVFTGHVVSMHPTSRGTLSIGVGNASSKLTRLRVNASFEGQSAGDVVSDLAGRAGVNTGNVIAGADLAYLLVDARKTAWEHITRLARISGHVVSINADDEIDFAPPSDGDVVQTFTVGQDVLQLRVMRMPPAFDSVTISGEGAAGSQGQDAWNWLVKQPSPVTGTAGQGAVARAFADRALRTADSVRAAATALADAAVRAATRGTLLVPGAPKVRPGLRIAIANSTDGKFNGDYLVTTVRHQYAKGTGFLTHINFAGAAGGVGGLGLPGGL